MPPVSRLLTAGLFLASYGSARGLAFLGPLLLPRVLSADTYGALELALSLAMLLGNAVGLGVPQATARLKLLLGQGRILDVLALGFLLSAVPLTAASLAADWFGAAPVVLITLALAAVYGGQYALSFWARVEGRRFLSTWVDSGTLVLLGIGAAVLLLLQADMSLQTIAVGVWGIAGLLLLGGGVVLSRHRSSDLWNSWRRALREGLPLLATGLVLAGLVAAPRLLAGRFLPLADVGALALAARLCLLLVVVHQLVATWHYRSFFTWPPARCDVIFTCELGVLCLLGCGVMLVWPWVGPLIAPEFPALPRLTVALVASQTILWIGIALFESMLGRQGLGKIAAPALAVVGAVAWGAIEGVFLWLPATPQTVALAGVGLLSCGAATQWLLLRRSGLYLPRAGLALLAAAIPPLLAL